MKFGQCHGVVITIASICIIVITCHCSNGVVRQANPTMVNSAQPGFRLSHLMSFVRMWLAPQDVLEAAFFLLAVRSLGKCRTGDGTCRDLMSRCKQIGPWPCNGSY